MEHEGTVATDDSTLWGAARDGDGDARAELARRGEEAARSYFGWRRVRGELLEDLLQDVQVSLLGFLDRNPEAPKNLRGFLKARARGVFTDHVRRRDRDRSRREPAAVAEPPDARPGPAAIVAGADVGEALAECRAALDEGLEAVWRMRYDEDQETRAIAAALGLTAAGVNTRAFRAHHALADCLRRKGVLR